MQASVKDSLVETRSMSAEAGRTTTACFSPVRARKARSRWISSRLLAMSA